MKIAIIGAGLAGGACAHFLKAAGHDVTVYDKADGPTAGASGNAIGMYNPKLSAEVCPKTAYHKLAFERAPEVFARFGDAIDWNPCGALHLITDEKRAIRYAKMVENWDWGKDHLRLVPAREASAIAGIPLSHEALHIARSGHLSPLNLTRAYLDGIDVRYGRPVRSLRDIEADQVIVACAHAASDFMECAPIALQKIRGQVTATTASETSARLRCCLHYGGYVSPAVRGTHMIGASFQRWLDHTDPLPDDDRDNMAKLEAVASGITAGMEVLSARASLRATARDQFPVVGAVGERVYVSLGHRSHGILSSLIAAQILAAMIDGRLPPVGGETLKCLDPGRFF
ncbi:MAG: FAD-dependent 5-carboxymethylaminomethyl-2-thiouridine(34) oxidoreductase MnmC [Alphaproteobacteria bacterium]|nr:FAD-dependent 5-carboxymethylaminomethyl-2-thiouridine(34) oxidoreductase MnmC [Alphaproteobacteria bacterium]